MTLEDYDAAVATLGTKDFTKDGTPKMKALNAALEAAGLDAIDADTRDQWHEAAQAVPEPDEDIPSDDVTFLLEAAPTSPLTLRVYGLGDWELAVGRTHTLPLAAFNALRNSNATVKEV